MLASCWLAAVFLLAHTHKAGTQRECAERLFDEAVKSYRRGMGQSRKGHTKILKALEELRLRHYGAIESYGALPP